MGDTHRKWGAVLVAGALLAALLAVSMSGIATAGSHGSDVHIEAENVTVYTNDRAVRINGTIHNEGRPALRNVTIELSNLPDGWAPSTDSVDRIESGESANFTIALKLSDGDQLEEREEVVQATATDRSGELAASPVSISIVPPPMSGDDNPPMSDGTDIEEISEESRYEQCIYEAEQSFWDTKTKFRCRLEFDKYGGIGGFISHLFDW